MHLKNDKMLWYESGKGYVDMKNGTLLNEREIKINASIHCPD